MQATSDIVEVNKMSLQISVKIKRGKADPRAKAWQDLIDKPPETLTYSRQPGTSRSGPCASCSQWFGVQHDGTGRIVPLRPLHPNCVCRDIPTQILDITPGESFPPMGRGDWIKDASRSAQNAVLGVAVAKMVRTGRLTIGELYKRPSSPLASIKPGKKIRAAFLKGSTKAELAKMASALEIKGAGKLSRKQLESRLRRFDISALTAGLD